jgi:hypothetical protein
LIFAHLLFLIVSRDQLSVGKWMWLQCDAWQASNTDGYFAVTGHWIEESTSSKWELKSTLLSFTWVSNAHNGEMLDQVLFKVFKWVRIEHKVCRLLIYHIFRSSVYVYLTDWSHHLW